MPTTENKPTEVPQETAVIAQSVISPYYVRAPLFEGLDQFSAALRSRKSKSLADKVLDLVKSELPELAERDAEDITSLIDGIVVAMKQAAIQRELEEVSHPMDVLRKQIKLELVQNTKDMPPEAVLQIENLIDAFVTPVMDILEHIPGKAYASFMDTCSKDFAKKFRESILDKIGSADIPLRGSYEILPDTETQVTLVPVHLATDTESVIVSENTAEILVTSSDEDVPQILGQKPLTEPGHDFTPKGGRKTGKTKIIEE